MQTIDLPIVTQVFDSAQQRIIEELQSSVNLLQQKAKDQEKTNAKQALAKEEQDKINANHEQAITELKLKVAELEQKDKEKEQTLDYFRQKFHLSSRRNFWQKYLLVVLRELNVKDIERASLGELWAKINKETYTAWRNKKLPSYEQVANVVPTVINEGNAAVHQSNMMELFEELRMTRDNVKFYEPMWDFIVEKCEPDWQKWSFLVAAKDEKS